MGSTFFGLETAKRGMYAQQSALYATGHNISNANTPGYTRQRVDFVQTSPYPNPGLNKPGIPGQMGTGVAAGSITRVRDRFIDVQLRTQNTNLGYYGGLRESLVKLEEIMNEPSTSGLHSVMEKFWNSLQTLANNTENSGARDVVASAGQMVADTFNYYYNSLTGVQKDLGTQIGVTIKEVNDTLNSINQLNKQIAAVEPFGMLPNDLYDARDTLVDKLSGLINIKVERVVPDNYGNVDRAKAEGLYQIKLLVADGTAKANLLEVDKTTGVLSTPNTFTIEPEPLTGPLTKIKVGGQTFTGEGMNFSGGLSALIQSYGYTDGAVTKGKYPEMIDKINKMAESFAKEFNALHANGYELGGIKPSGTDFFEIGNPPAQSIKVRDEIKKDPAKIAAGGDSGASGDNTNAQNLADIKTKAFASYSIYSGGKVSDGLNGNLDSYYSGMIGSLGVESQSAYQDFSNATAIAASIEERRQSVSSVSLDEEMINMIKFQHAYNASARNITVVDEMLDKIINGMGVVGR